MQWHKVLAESIAIRIPHSSLLKYSSSVPKDRTVEMCCLYNCMRDTIKTSARESFSLPVIYLYNWMQWHKVLAELVPIMSPHCSLLRYSLNIFLPLYHRSTMSGERMLKKLGGCYTLVLIVIIIIIISGCSRTKFQQDRLPLRAHNIS